MYFGEPLTSEDMINGDISDSIYSMIKAEENTFLLLTGSFILISVVIILLCYKKRFSFFVKISITFLLPIVFIFSVVKLKERRDENIESLYHYMRESQKDYEEYKKKKQKRTELVEKLRVISWWGKNMAENPDLLKKYKKNDSAVPYEQSRATSTEAPIAKDGDAARLQHYQKIIEDLLH